MNDPIATRDGQGPAGTTDIARALQTAADDRALFGRVAALRRVKLTLNENEIWMLYQLARHEKVIGPSVAVNYCPDGEVAVGTALAKLSDALLTLQDREAKG